jgi:hypothetical protein
VAGEVLPVLEDLEDPVGQVVDAVEEALADLVALRSKQLGVLETVAEIPLRSPTLAPPVVVDRQVQEQTHPPRVRLQCPVVRERPRLYQARP